jgi:hypothetical protein
MKSDAHHIGLQEAAALKRTKINRSGCQFEKLKSLRIRSSFFASQMALGFYFATASAFDHLRMKSRETIDSDPVRYADEKLLPLASAWHGP